MRDWDLDELLGFEYKNIPLGKLILPSLRWILRSHHLKDDETTRTLAAAYIRSAWNVYQEFTICLSAVNPQSVVVFNGMFFPEAAARLAAREQGIKVYSHEVGMRPFSVFMTDKEATAYPVDVQDNFQLTDAQNDGWTITSSAALAGIFQPQVSNFGRR